MVSTTNNNELFPLGFTADEIEIFRGEMDHDATFDKLKKRIGLLLTDIEVNETDDTDGQRFTVHSDKYNPLYLLAKSDETDEILILVRTVNLNDEELVSQVETILDDKEYQSELKAEDDALQSSENY